MFKNCCCAAEELSYFDMVMKKRKRSVIIEAITLTLTLITFVMSVLMYFEPVEEEEAE